jgi:hypothetical protein
MKKGYLSEYFSDFAYKRLSMVEADRHRSNQHEFDGVSALKRILGPDRKKFPTTFIYLADATDEALREDAFLTWYDARETHPTRSEHRLYFPDTVVSEKAAAGDFLVIARRQDGSLLLVIAQAGSTVENQLLWLFGIAEGHVDAYAIAPEARADEVQLAFASRYVLEQLGIDLETDSVDYLDEMLSLFGGRFPGTRVFSEFARSTLDDIDLEREPDAAVLAWIGREEALFRILERHLIGDRLREGFADDVDAFISFSLSVQNRRKSRAGSALENHLEYLFTERGIRHSRTAVTEGRAKPDFLFPGQQEYLDTSFRPDLLTMLGVKSTCKDRWRQVLAEADRIPQKHLLTLEPSISATQTDEMRVRDVQLVLPAGIHATYNEVQRAWIMTVENLIAIVLERQAKTIAALG